MNLKQDVSRLEQVFQDNPSIGILAVSCVAAGLFIGLIVLPQFLRRMRRRAREKRRKVQV